MDTTTPSLVLTPESELAAPLCVTLETVKAPSGETDWDATTTKLQEAYADFPDDDSGPAWKSALSTLRVQEHERELIEHFGGTESLAGEMLGVSPTVLAGMPSDGSIPGLRIGEWITELWPGPGRVIDEERAKGSVCTRVAIGDDYYLTSNPWIAGWLDAGQEEQYCRAGVVTIEASPEDTVRLRALTEAAMTCSLEANQQPDIFFSCLGKELRKAGVS